MTRVRPLRYLLVLLAVIVLTVGLAAAYLVFLFDWNSARDRLGSAASRAAHREVRIGGELDVDWHWPVTVITMNDLEVANFEGGSAPNMLDIAGLQAAIDLRALLHGTLRFTRLELQQPRLLLEKTADGRANWQLSDNPAGAVALAPLPDERAEFPLIAALVIDEGRITYRDARSGNEVSVQAATVAGAAPGDAGRSHFSGHGVTGGQRFTFDLEGGSVLALREGDAPFPIAATVKAGPTSATLRGTLSDPLRAREFDLELHLAGQNAADLYPLTGIALLPSPPYEVRGRLGHAGRRWSFHEFRGRMGGSDLSGDLDWDKREPRPLLTAQFVSRELDLADLGGFVGARTPPPAGASRVIPDVPLDISRLAAMDARVDFVGQRLISRHVPLDDFHARFTLEDRLLVVEPLHFGSGNGDVSLRLSINGRDVPFVIDTQARLRRVPLAPFTKAASSALGETNLTRGAVGGTVLLEGTGASVRDMLASADGSVSLGMEGGQVSVLMVELLGLDVAESLGYLVAGDAPVPIRCLIGDFVVEDGMMRARTLVFDTDDTVVRGEGHIDLHDESLHLALKPAPKDFSPLVLRAPLELTGTLKDPEPRVQTRGLIGRGVAAAVLALVAPPAAIVAFIEPGLGQDSHCQALIDSMVSHSEAPEATRALVPGADDGSGGAP